MTPTTRTRRPRARLARGLRRLALAAALAAAWPGAGPAGAAEPAPAGQGAERWKDEFADICAKTQDAMTLKDAELRALVERCDALKPAIARLDEPLRKVYSRRLQACRELYQFVLDSRVKEPAK